MLPVDYAMRYSRGQPKHVMMKFIKMYVNDITVDMGTMVEKLFKKMFKMGQGKEYFP